MSASQVTFVAITDPLSDANPVRKVGMLTSLLFVFLYVSRVTDLTLSSLHLPFIIAGLAAVAASLSGTLLPTLKTRTALILIAITAWICLGTIFSIWRGGSVFIITQNWVRSVLVALLVISLVASVKEVRYLMDTIALAVLVAALIGLRSGIASSDGRLEIAGYSRISNPNDLAFTMMLGMPLWWMNLTSGGALRRCFAALALLPIAACFLKTGSRGGLFALVALGVVAFLRSPITGKMRILIAAVLAAVVGFAMLPPYLRQRYFTFDSADTSVTSIMGERAAGMAATSAMQRRGNLMDSIRITLQHPVFGVGVGNFAVAQDLEAKAAGRPKGSWLGTHNTYTQLSSECGIPVLILFLALLATAMRELGSARRLASRLTARLATAESSPLAVEIRKAAYMTDLVMWGMCVCIFFSHIGYDMTIYLMVSLCVVLARAARRELVPAAIHPTVVSLPPLPADRSRSRTRSDIPLSALMPASRSSRRIRAI